MRKRSPENRKSIRENLKSVMEYLPTNSIEALNSAEVYLMMSQEGINALPAFNPDGSVKFYEVGGVLLGKSALIKFIETTKNK